MEDAQSVAMLMNSTTSKIQQLQKAFAELESHRAVTLNLKWKQLEEHFHGLEKSLKRRFTELEDQEKEFETKIVKSKEILQKREADVIAKEQASLEKLQEKRDAAVSAITLALERHKNPFSVEPSAATADQDGVLVLEKNIPDILSAEDNVEVDVKAPENMTVEVKSYPELVNLCQEMNSEGLHKFISDNRKNLAAIKEELPIALRASANPASLVLDSLKGFYSLEMPNSDAKKDSNLLGLRRTCIMLMECLSIFLSNMEKDSLSIVVTNKIQEQAKGVAEEWKPKLDELDGDANSGNSLEVHAFLQLLSTFGIYSDFDSEELSKLIPMVARRRQAADLCRSLGLTDKMPGVVDILVNNGRHIDAVNLAFAFDLTKRFPPVLLLKSYLNEAIKVSSPVRTGNGSPTIQNEVNEKELTALKAVIKCIEEHKLEDQYPVDPLQKRVSLLEKVKADKKRGTEVAKPQPKRPRANGVGFVPRVSNVVVDKAYYPRTTERYAQYIYERPYAYAGPTDNHIPSILGTAAYSLNPGHANFFAAGYHYQAAPYLH